MFIFSRDFSHPRQKISAKCQPFSNSKVHFNHSPIRQKNYNMSNTFYKIPKYMISTFCHLAKHFTSKNGSFFVFFGNLQRGFSPPKKPTKRNAPQWSPGHGPGSTTSGTCHCNWRVANCASLRNQFPTHDLRGRRCFCAWFVGSCC